MIVTNKYRRNIKIIIFRMHTIPVKSIRGFRIRRFLALIQIIRVILKQYKIILNKIWLKSLHSLTALIVYSDEEKKTHFNYTVITFGYAIQRYKKLPNTDQLSFEIVYWRIKQVVLFVFFFISFRLCAIKRWP